MAPVLIVGCKRTLSSRFGLIGIKLLHRSPDSVCAANIDASDVGFLRFVVERVACR